MIEANVTYINSNLTHMRVHAGTRARPGAPSHVGPDPYTQTFAHIRTHELISTRAQNMQHTCRPYTHEHRRTLPHAYRHIRTNAPTHMRAHTRMHAHTQA